MLFVNVIKPTHLCNLDCTYCYNDDERKPIMSKALLERSIEQTFAYARAHGAIDAVDFIWHGGEPTVAGIEFYENALQYQAEYAENVAYKNSLQTNGVLLDARWIEFLKQHDFSLSISIDGPQHINDAYRKTHLGKGTFDRVFAAIKRVRDAAIPFGVCMVLSKASAPHTKEILDFFGREKLPFNVIPMTKSGAARSRFDDIGMDANEYADAWIPMYSDWLQSGDGQGSYVYVQDFVLKTRAIVSGRSADCIGMANCSHFNVSVDPLGDVYPCASLSGNRTACYGNLQNESLESLLQSPVAIQYRTRAVDPHCAQCKWQHVCHGGCVSRAHKFYGQTDHRDYYCPSLFRIYEHIEMQLGKRGLRASPRHPLHMSDGLPAEVYALPVMATGSRRRSTVIPIVSA